MSNKIVTFLILISRFPHKSRATACTPNSESLLNGKICHCNDRGEWNEKDCGTIVRTEICTPGQVVYQGCSRCVCQHSGQMFCRNDTTCAGTLQHQKPQESLASVLPWCSPTKTYYINCNICQCSGNGKSLDALCVLDVSCNLFKGPTVTEITSRTHTCIPKVMYLFPCLHCLCSDDGHFSLHKCVETCVRNEVESTRRCIPRTLYRQNCNVCLCPENSIPDDKICTNNTCVSPIAYRQLNFVKRDSIRCTPHKFVAPSCVYCECNHDGEVDKTTCIDSAICLESGTIKYDVRRDFCSPGEMVPFCQECLCTGDSMVSVEHCSKACSYQSKLEVLEKIMTLPNKEYIIDNSKIKSGNGEDACEPGSIYIDKNRFCICPDTGITNFNLCTKVVAEFPNKRNKTSVNIAHNISCEPKTFVEFDCNTCYCSKTGKINADWCTYDDCESKRLIQNSHTVHLSIIAKVSQPKETCVPGSISLDNCNFCICPNSGITKERVCTKNNCSSDTLPVINPSDFACEPLTYYDIDCNVCFCPESGLKNVAKCTKKHCDKISLRSDICMPCQLFSDACNVCVCPPNGNRAEKACTNHECSDTVPLRKIYQQSESLLGDQIRQDDVARNLDLCFPGEEFIVECKLCVCPETGIRMYATCSPSHCEKEQPVNE